MSKKVDKKMDIWKKKLLDMGMRNRLLNYKDTKRGNINITTPKLSKLYKLLVQDEKELIFPRIELQLQDVESLIQDDEEEQTEVTKPIEIPGDFSTDRSARETTQIAKNLKDKAKTAKEEQGVNILYASFGFLEWKEADHSNIVIKSPLVLVPVVIASKGIADPYTLSLHEDEIVINPTLSYKLETEFGITLPEFDSQNDDIEAYLSSVNDLVAKSGWKVVENVSISLLSFLRINIYKDLEKMADVIVENRIVKALAGEGKPLTLDDGITEEYDHDSSAIQKVFQVVDADSSQQDAISMTKKGVSFVLQGPPGTGKSQTITNIIAEALGAGKKVLFVSEKMAALEVVYRRLENVGLSDFCLVLHSNKANKREFMESLRKVTNLKPIEVKDSALFKLSTLEDRRDRLNEYAEELHERIDPLGQSIFEANGILAHYDYAPNIDFVLDKAKIKALTREDLYNIRLSINELVRTKQKLAEDYGDNTWKNSVIDELDHERRHNLSSDLDDVISEISEYLSEAEQINSNLFLDLNVDIYELRQLIAFLSYCATTPGFPVQWFNNENIDALVSTAKELLERQKREKALKGTISQDIGVGLLKQNASDALCILDRKLDDAQSVMNDSYQDEKTLIENIDNIIELLSQTNDVLEREEKIIDKVHGDIGITMPGKQSDVPGFAMFIKKYSTNMKPDEFWFSSEWDEKSNRAAVVNKAKAIIDSIRQTRQVVLEKYDKEVIDIDYRGILTRMKTDYTSFLRIFKSGYKADMNTLRAFCKTPTKKLSYEDQIDILEKIKLHHEALSELDENSSVFKQYLGGWFVGEDTDFSAVESAIDAFEVVKSVYKDNIPYNVRQELLSGKNIGKYNSDSETLSTFCNDERIDRFIAMCKENTHSVAECINVNNWISGALSSFRSELKGIIESSKADVTLYTCYDGLKKLSELQKLEELDKSETSDLQERFYELYKGFETDWEDILKRLHWLQKYDVEVKKISVKSDFEHGIASGETFAKKIARHLDFLKSFESNTVPKLQRFDELFTEEEGLLDKKLSLQMEKAKHCKDNLEGLEDWIDFKNAIARCTDLGLDDYIEKLLNSSVKAEDYEAVFMKKFERLWLDFAVKDKPAVKSFRGKNQDDLIEEFRKLDLEQLVIARSRIREKLINSIPNVSSFTSSQDEVGILMHELGKQRKIMPVRKMFDKIPNLLPILKPCMMMSPLSVSQFVQSDNYMFDMVIFDEASQVKTENAIGAISRGKQVIIAGDVHQLPPTNFFASSVFGSDEYEEDEDDSEAFESILDEANTIMPQLTLKWHYRSKNEDLIAFSNAKIYNNSLTTFPSPSENQNSEGVEFIYVPDGVYQRSGKRNNPIEAKQVVDVIFDEIENHPYRSLGVITFSEAQQRCVEAEVIARRLADPSHEDFFAEDRNEPFFIKNLENVQGDERDTIVFSIGYGKASTLDELKMNFGPINKSGGYRRLNVAVTRAKYAIKLVGSFLPTDMRINDDTPRGVKLLRDYIEFAQQGVKAIENQLEYSDIVNTDSPFEDSVLDYLTRNGYSVKTQVGCSGYRIDMAVRHPSLEGRFVLGVECDGATYHSSRTARERDRLRQSVLESMGWRIYRIWSTDWVKDPVTEGKHLLDAVSIAIKEYKDPSQLQRKSKAKKERQSESKYEKTVEAVDDSTGYGFEVYEEIEYPKSAYEKPISTIAQEIEKIVEAQSPVNVMLVCKQLAPLYGNTKVTSKVKDGVLSIVRSHSTKNYTMKDNYLWLKDQTEVIPRVPKDGDKPRPMDMVAPEELEEAIATIIDKSFGIEKEALFKVVAKEYGFARTTEKMLESLENAYTLLEKAKRIQSTEGKLSIISEDSKPVSSSRKTNGMSQDTSSGRERISKASAKKVCPDTLIVCDANFDSFVAYDFETTGFSPTSDSIIEIGAIKVVDGKVKGTKALVFSEFIKPEKKALSAQITRITGITKDDLKDARTLQEVIPEFVKFIGNDILIGFNNARFDSKFLVNACRECNVVIENPNFDVLQYVKSNKDKLGYCESDCKLNTVAEYVGVANPQAHRAWADALTTAKVYLKLRRKLK